MTNSRNGRAIEVRVTQRLVENPLAEMIVSGALCEGATVIADRDGDRLSLAVAGGR